MAEPISDTLPPKETPKPGEEGGNTPLNKEKSPDPIEDLKNQVDREKARAATALQSEETAKKNLRNEKILRIAAEKKLRELTGTGGDNPPAPGKVNAEGNDAEMERINAEKGIANLLMMSPEYQALLSKDETLKEIMLSNPLSLISEYIDAEDAVDQIKNKLDKKISASSGGATPPAGDGKPVVKAGDVPPPSSESIEMKGNVAPDAAVKMSAEEWAKLPKEQRGKMLMGEF